MGTLGFGPFGGRGKMKIQAVTRTNDQGSVLHVSLPLLISSTLLILSLILLMFDVDPLWYVMLMSALCAVPFAARYGNIQLRSWDPVMLVSIAYFLNYPIGFLILYDTDDSFILLQGKEVLSASMAWACVSFAFFMVAYYVIRTNQTKCDNSIVTEKDIIAADTDLKFISALGWFAILGTLLSIHINGGVEFTFVPVEGEGDSGGFTGMVSLYMFTLFYPYFFLYSTYYFNRFEKRKPSQKLLLFSCLLYGIVAAGSGAKILFFNLLICVLLPLLLSRPKFSRAQIGLGFVVLAFIYLIFTSVSIYRDIVKESLPDNKGDPIETLNFQVSGFSKALGIIALNTLQMHDPHESAIEQIQTINMLTRMGSGVYELASLFRLSNFESPHENEYSSLLFPVYALVPRSVWPSKPVFFDSAEHASYYGWSWGGLSVSFIGSLYWAWGYVGICCGFAILGIISGVLVGWAQQSGFRNPLASGIMVLFLLSIIYPGLTFQVVFINLVRYTLIFLAIDTYFKIMNRSNQTLKSCKI